MKSVNRTDLPLQYCLVVKENCFQGKRMTNSGYRVDIALELFF